MTGKLVTVFGGGGFLGRYVAQELLARGARVRVAERDPGGALRVKTQGNLGQVQLFSANVAHAQSVAAAVQGADAVVNLVGILSGNFARVHVEGAETVAKAAKAAGASAMVHISAIGADPQSTSAYGRSKAEGEAAVRAAFAQATILRPSIIFGREDQFINRFARIAGMAPVVPVIGGGTKFQPVYVADVARAIATAVLEPETCGGKLFELGGPEVLSMSEINAWIGKAIGRSRPQLPVPGFVAGILAALPGGPLTRDQLKMLANDNVVAPGAPGLAELGVVPTPLAAVAERWLVLYRKHGRFAGRAEA